MFLETTDRIINLSKVSNINILSSKNRIVFNLNYSIEIINDEAQARKIISDYVYWDAVDAAQFSLNVEKLENSSYFENFLSGTDADCYINKNEISSVKFIDRQFRTIFNLSHSIVYKCKNGRERVTSEFVYVNCRNLVRFNNYKEYVKKRLGE